MGKIALLIAVSEYESGLNPLPATIKDVEAMQRVLQNPEIGGFEVECLLNPDPLQMQTAIENLFLGSQRDDIVLLYFSGHGIKHDNGKLYFATKSTRKHEQGELSRASTVSADFVHDIINDNRSRSRRQVIILDCCFSGAFSPGTKGEDDISLNFEKVQLGGEGRAVLTSSTSTQYSFESVYTPYLVQGIETGEADENNDGFISVNELHQYVQRKVQEGKHEMKPQIQAVIKEGFNIVLTKAPNHNREDIYKGIVKSWIAIADDGQISKTARTALIEQQQRLEIESDKATAIEEEVLKPYKDYLRRLDLYKTQFIRITQENNPISETDHNELKRLQQVLGLRDEDTAKIEDSHKRKLNLGNQFIGILSLGIISFAVAWYIKPDKECPPCKLPPIKITNQFAQVHNVPEGKFKYGGSTSWSFMYPKLESEIKKTHPQFEINIRKDLVQGSGIGIEKLIDGELDFALSSRDVSSEEKDEAGKKHFSLKAIPVVKSGVAVAVNPKLEINSLTKDQVSEIFSGKIDNWRQAGDPADIPIKLYIRSRNSASTDEFRKTLNIVSFGKNINYVDTTNEGLQEITREPGGIFVGPISNIVPQCGVKTLPIINKGKTFYPYQQQNFVSPAECGPSKRNPVNIEAIDSDEYPFPVRFYVVVKENGQKEQQAGEAYANLLQTEQGKNMIRQLQETGGLDKNK